VGAADGGGDEVRSVNEAEAWEMGSGRGHRGARSMAMGRRLRRRRGSGEGGSATQHFVAGLGIRAKSRSRVYPI
jgi:hypothetical protein